MLVGRVVEEHSPLFAGLPEAVTRADSDIGLATVGPRRVKADTCLGQHRPWTAAFGEAWPGSWMVAVEIHVGKAHPKHTPTAWVPDQKSGNRCSPCRS